MFRIYGSKAAPIFAGGAVYANLPPGLFGDYDMLIRAVVTSTVADTCGRAINIQSLVAVCHSRIATDHCTPLQSRLKHNLIQIENNE